MTKLSDKPTAKLAAVVGLDGRGNVRSMPVIETAASLPTIALPSDIRWFQTAGYYHPADGGAAHYVRTDGSGHLVSADGAHWSVAELEPNVRMFGARGDGSDDTASIEAAHAYATARRQPAPKGVINFLEVGTALRFPPGAYSYGGKGLVQDGGTVALIGSAGSVSIMVTSDAYFLTARGLILGSHVDGLNFIGGRGAIRYTNSQQNVAGLHRIENCNFADYTECAIGNNSTDHPYLKVRSCSFFGSKAGGSIGIAWGGYLDSTTIEDCAFLLNKYHMKLGPRIGGSVNISKNDFIAFRKNIRTADIWIVPSEGEVNSGSGFTIERNKFGNENLSPDQPRILVAREDEESGADRLTRRHSEAWVSGRPTLRGVVLAENRIDGVSGMVSPLIRSHIANLDALECVRNYFGGGIHTYLCEFMADGETDMPVGPSLSRWNVELSPFFQPFSRGISNRPVGTILDPYAMLPGLASALPTSIGGDDEGFVSLLDLDGTSGVGPLAAAGLAATGSEPEANAKPDAARRPKGLSQPLRRVTSGRTSWLDIEFGSLGSDRPLGLAMQIVHPETRIIAVRRRALVKADGTHLRIPFVFPETGTPDGWQLVLSPMTGAAGILALIAHVRVYQSSTALASGNLRTLGSGGWQGGHLVLGGYHLWLDANGRLRVKRGAPSSDRDGSIVGQR